MVSLPACPMHIYVCKNLATTLLLLKAVHDSGCVQHLKKMRMAGAMLYPLWSGVPLIYMASLRLGNSLVTVHGLGLTKPPLKLQYRWVNVSHLFMMMELFIHIIIPMLIYQIFVGKRSLNCRYLNHFFKISSRMDTHSVTVFQTAGWGPS